MPASERVAIAGGDRRRGGGRRKNKGGVVVDQIAECCSITDARCLFDDNNFAPRG